MLASNLALPLRNGHSSTMIVDAILVDHRDQKSSDKMLREDEQYCFIIASRTGAARRLSETVLRPAVESAGFLRFLLTTSGSASNSPPPFGRPSRRLI